MTGTVAADRLIVALDFPSAAEALAQVERLDGQVRWFKVGLELYLAAGRSIVDGLTASGYNVFLDLKLHDIPNTVAAAVRMLAGSGASLLTVHAGGGEAMLAAAAEASAVLDGGPKLLAVTVLTSMNAPQLGGVGVQGSPAEQVVRLGTLAMKAGMAGLVCSAEEAGALREKLGEEPLFVVPGIRPAGAALGDQQRVATPGEAMRAGASMLVVGRPITHANDPGRVVEAILAEMRAGLVWSA